MNSLERISNNQHGISNIQVEQPGFRIIQDTEAGIGPVLMEGYAPS